MNVFLIGLYCDPISPYTTNVECYSGINILHTCMAGLGMLIFCFLQYYFITLYTEIKLNNEIPFAQSQGKHDLIKQIIKLLILLYITIDYDGVYAKTYVVILSVLYLLLIVIRIWDPSHFQNDIFNFILCCDSIQFTIALSFTFHVFLDTGSSDDVGFYFILTGIPFMYYCVIQLVHKKQQYLYIKGIKKLDDPYFHEQYFNQLIHIIEKREDSLKYIYLEGILIQHSETCISTVCPCARLIDSKQKDQDEMIYFKLMMIMIQQSITRFPKCPRLYITSSYIYLDKLHNKFKCYYALQTLKTLETSFQEEQYILKITQTIEEQMLEEDQKAEIVVDVVQVVRFQKYYGELQVRLEESVKRHYDFWSELSENNPDINKLYQLGGSITQSVEDVKETYEKLMAINPNHINTLKIYGKFQNDVINNDQFGTRITEKAEQIERALSTYSGDAYTSDRYGENSQTCILTCSAEIKDLGTILSCNKEIEILGYHKYELIGQNIARLMPKIYANNHDKFMIHYLETSESKVVGIEREVMCLDKLGAMTPCSLLFKVLPILGKGIRMVAFMKLLKKDRYHLLFDPKTLQILGMTLNCSVQFGLPLNFVFGASSQSGEFTMETIIQDYKVLQEKSEAVDNLNQVPFHLTLDSTKLKDLFIIEENDNLSEQLQEMDEEKDKLTPFRVQKIKCYLQYFRYSEDFQVMMLQFSELTEVMDLGKSTHYNFMESKHVKSKTKTKSSETMKKKMITHHNADDFINEDRSSVNSVQSSINDEMRRLKDAKAMMSEKQVPRNIRVIQITMFLLTLVLMTVSVTDLILKQNQSDQFTMAIQMLHNSYSRSSEIASLLIYCQLLKLNVNQNDNITDRLYQLQQIEFDLFRVETEFAKYGIDIPKLPSYNFTFSLDNSIYNHSLRLRDGIREYVNYIVVFEQNSTQEDNYYFLSTNGFNNIRDGTLKRNGELALFFKDQMQGKFITFLILMIISIFILIITHTIVIPILIKVDVANNKVLSMFGLIQLEDIKELAHKCEEYLQKCIEDYKERKELEKKIEQQPQQDQQQQGQLQEDKNYIEVNNEEDQEDELKKQEEERLKKIEEEEKRKEKEKIKQQNQNRYLRKKNKKKHKYQIHEIELSEQERERVDKLERTSNNKDKFTMFKFLFFFLIFSGFFSMQLGLETVFIDAMQELTNHLMYCNQRSPILTYRLIFGIEDVIDEQRYYIDDVWMSEFYHNSLYDIERDVFESFKSFSLTGFSNYKKQYNWMNFDNMCLNISLMNDPQLSQAECEGVQNGILEKGLRTSVVNLALYANDTLRVGADIEKVIYGDPLQTLLKLMKYQNRALVTLSSTFLSDSKSYIDFNQMIEIIKFVIFLFFWILLFFLIWMPYLTLLSKQIWQTKGMLNMIPMVIIQKNEKLKYKFLQDSIVKMVQ